MLVLPYVSEFRSQQFYRLLLFLCLSLLPFQVLIEILQSTLIHGHSFLYLPNVELIKHIPTTLLLLVILAIKFLDIHQSLFQLFLSRV